MSRSDEWYSDEALRKQAELKRRQEVREMPTWSLLSGVLEARVPAGPDETCHCGLDARAGAGGDGRRCGLCIGRDE